MIENKILEYYRIDGPFNTWNDQFMACKLIDNHIISFRFGGNPWSENIYVWGDKRRKDTLNRAWQKCKIHTANKCGFKMIDVYGYSKLVDHFGEPTFFDFAFLPR